MSEEVWKDNLYLQGLGEITTIVKEGCMSFIEQTSVWESPGCVHFIYFYIAGAQSMGGMNEWDWILIQN